MAQTGIFCSGAHVLRKAGVNVNSTVSGAEAFVNDFIAQAESYINVASRNNWSDDYGSLNADVKEILKEAASDLAAIYFINYDMSGYTSRSEAESMVTILRDRANHCISLLRDKKSEDFIDGA